MKNLILKLILPLSVISFGIFTKWWYVLPVDAPDTMYSGFPLPYVGAGWHTSMSLQIFILEFLVDFITYFFIWFIIIFCINKYIVKMKLYKVATIILWLIAGMIFMWAFFIASFPGHIFYIKRPYDIEVMETGYKFVWERIERPDYDKYHPTK